MMSRVEAVLERPSLYVDYLDEQTEAPESEFGASTAEPLRLSVSDSLRTLLKLGLDHEAEVIAHAVGMALKPIQADAAQTASDWLPGAFAQLDRLGGLEQGWDGHESPPISAAALSSAEQLMSGLARTSIPLPHISPVPGGGIQIEWHSGARSVEVEFLVSGAIEYSVFESDDELESGALTAHESDRLIDLVGLVDEAV